MARISLVYSEIATTDGSFSTIPFPGMYTNVFAVPRSIPSFGEKILIDKWNLA
jgi:hypothetical protein